MCQCEIGTEGYNDTEKVEKSTCENAMKSSIIIYFWKMYGYLYLTLD